VKQLELAAPQNPFRRYTKRDERGKRKECLLSVVYRNMKGRANGTCTKSPWVYVQGWPWKSYAEWRAWALASGFTKANCSPDRRRTAEPYGPHNVKWVPVHVNNATSSGRCWYMRGHDDVRGEEPPLPPLVDDAVPLVTPPRRRDRTGRALDAPNDVPF
jgi:hypothetical protein